MWVFIWSSAAHCKCTLNLCACCLFNLPCHQTTLCFAQTYMLEGHDFRNLLADEDLPNARESIRKAAIKLCILRTITSVAAGIRATGALRLRRSSASETTLVASKEVKKEISLRTSPKVQLLHQYLQCCHKEEHHQR